MAKSKEMNVLKSIAKRVIPREHRLQLRIVGERWKNRWIHFGFAQRWIHFGFARFCPCCKARLRRFTPCGLAERYALGQRQEAICPVCQSKERHRLVWLYMTEKANLFDGNQKKMLHVAPEPELSELIQKADYINYLSADLTAPNAMVKMDITDIQYPDSTFDVIYCSHVLEHVYDDRKAMREFYRVLKPGGWAILQVPITADTTFEDPTASSPKERERLFGQFDHVRRYGPDYKDRLMGVGFSVTVDGFVRELDDRAVRRFGLMRDEDVYFCRKQDDMKAFESSSDLPPRQSSTVSSDAAIKT